MENFDIKAVKDQLQALYLEWLNNFITVDSFAGYYMLNKNQATELINIGRQIHQERTEK